MIVMLILGTQQVLIWSASDSKDVIMMKTVSIYV